MARMKHPKGDLEMAIHDIDVSGSTLIINGKMGVWTAQIFFEPEDIIVMVRQFIKFKMLLYFVLLPFRMISQIFKRKA